MAAPNSHDEIMEEVHKQLNRLMLSEKREISWIEAESPYVSEYPIKDLAIKAGFQTTKEMLEKEFSDYIKFVGENVVKAKKKLYGTAELQHVISLQQRTPAKTSTKRGRGGRGRGGKLRGKARGGHSYASEDTVVPVHPKRGGRGSVRGRGYGSIRGKAVADNFFTNNDDNVIPVGHYPKLGRGAKGSGSHEKITELDSYSTPQTTVHPRKKPLHLERFGPEKPEKNKENEKINEVISKPPTLSAPEYSGIKDDKQRPKIIKTSMMLSNINKHLSSIKITK